MSSIAFIVLGTILSFTLGIQLRQCPKTSLYQITSHPFSLGEGPHWDIQTQRLYFVDIYSNSYHSYNPRTGRITGVNTNCTSISFIVPVAHSPDKFIISCGTDVVLVKWDGKYGTGRYLRTLSNTDPDRDNIRLNDAKVDSAGRLWTGTISTRARLYEQSRQGTLYRIGRDLIPIKVYNTPVSISNGIGWNIPDDTMYYADTPTRKIKKFTFDPRHGVIFNEKTLFHFDTYGLVGGPDGLTVDVNGNLWVAQFGGSQILHIDGKNGQLICVIPLPASQVASVTFGGRNLDVLYITTGSSRDIAQDVGPLGPYDGFVFAVYGLGPLGRNANDFAL